MTSTPLSPSIMSDPSGPHGPPPPRGGGGETLWSIQYLRALAALAVVAYHASLAGRHPFEVGQAGVDLFFVISGFIMWTITEGSPARPLHFLRRRIARVVPLYWLLTLVLAGVVWLAPTWFPRIHPEPWHVGQSLFFIPHYGPDGLPFPLIAPGWSLNYEAAFYLLFAACLLLPRNRRIWAMGALLGALAGAGYIWYAAFTLLLNPLLLEFLAGLVIGELFARKAVPGRVVSVVVITAGIAALAWQQWSYPAPGLWRFALWGGPSALIVLGAAGLERSGSVPRLPVLKMVGDASYSIYLCHLPVMMALAYAWTFPGYIPAAAVIATAAGLACWRWVERPLLKLRVV